MAASSSSSSSTASVALSEHTEECVLPDVVLTISVSASRFSVSFNDHQPSMLQLMKRSIDRAPPPVLERERSPSPPIEDVPHRVTTGAAIRRPDAGSPHASAVVATETYPLIAVEGSHAPNGESSARALTAALAESIADRLVASAAKAPGASGPALGEEVLTYALGHTSTGKTTLLLGPIHGATEGNESRTNPSDTRSLPADTTGLLEGVVRRLFDSGTDRAAGRLASTRIVAMSVLEVLEAPYLTPLDDSGDGADEGTAGLAAADLVSGLRGRLLCDRCPDSDARQEEQDRSHTFMVDPADIPATQYVRVSSASEAMEVLQRCLSRAQSWSPASSKAPARPRAQRAGDAAPAHLLVTLLVGSTRTGALTVSGIWKLWDLCGPPPSPVTAETFRAAVCHAGWGWPWGVTQRLRDLASFPAHLASDRDKTEHGGVSRGGSAEDDLLSAPLPFSSAAPIIASARRTSSLVVVLGHLLHDACADPMNAYTLEHLNHWARARSSPRQKHNPQAPMPLSTRCAENIHAATVAIRLFSLPASEWLPRTCEPAVAQERDASDHPLLTSAAHTGAATSEGASVSQPGVHGTPHGVMADSTVATADARRYARDLSLFSSGIDGPHSDSGIEGSGRGVDGKLGSSALTTSGTARQPRVNRAAQAARAATRHEDEHRRRFVFRHTSALSLDASAREAPAALIGESSASHAEMSGSGHTPLDDSLCSTPLARSSPPPPATVQTGRPDSPTRRAQQPPRPLSLLKAGDAPLFPSSLTALSEVESTPAELTPLETDTMTEAQWRRHFKTQLHARVVPVLEDIATGATATQSTDLLTLATRVEEAAWEAAAPLVRLCVQSAKVASASRLAWEEERDRTRDLLARMTRLESQLARLVPDSPAAFRPDEREAARCIDTTAGTHDDALPTEADDGRDLPTPISPVQASRDRSLSASQSLSATVSAAAPHVQLAQALARSVTRCTSADVRGGRQGAKRKAQEPTTSPVPPCPAHAVNGEAPPLFDIELVTPDVPSTENSDVDDAKAVMAPCAATAPSRAELPQPSANASSPSTVWLELTLNPEAPLARLPPSSTEGNRVTASHDPSSSWAVAANNTHTTLSDSLYPTAEVANLRNAASAVQQCALTVLSCELERRNAADTSTVGQHVPPARQADGGTAPLTHTPVSPPLAGYMETPEKPHLQMPQPLPSHLEDDYTGLPTQQSCARAVPAHDAVAKSVQAATLTPFSPHTLQMERKLYDAVSAMQSASAAVEEQARRTAEREQAYLQAVLFAPSSPTPRAVP